ncbi:MAG: sigma-70 family RNA polymerase sigma factor [Candidatus Acidiferrum sp.]
MTPQGTTGETTTDWSLLARIGQKDEDALSALYDRYSGLVFSEAKRILRDTGAAEEILQDLFYQVWRTAERFDPARGSLAGWLLVAARNRAISKLRRKTGKTEEIDEKGVSLKVDVESRAAQSLLLDKVRTVMGNLPENQREALECAYFEGMSHTEIAEKTGQPLGTVKTRIRSAMEALKKVLS